MFAQSGRDSDRWCCSMCRNVLFHFVESMRTVKGVSRLVVIAGSGIVMNSLDLFQILTHWPKAVVAAGVVNA
jgi:hypothetical protein